MAVQDDFVALCGDWVGTNYLYLPPDPRRHSAVLMEITAVVMNRFLAIDYSWHFDNEPQAGLLLLGGQDGRYTATWADSWHMGDDSMVLEGAADPGGAILVTGQYTVGDSPPWGWRIELRPQDERLQVLMFNIMPEGEEMLAVEMSLRRRP